MRHQYVEKLATVSPKNRDVSVLAGIAMKQLQHGLREAIGKEQKDKDGRNRKKTNYVEIRIGHEDDQSVKGTVK